MQDEGLRQIAYVNGGCSHGCSTEETRSWV
jgi:hypothetical protein